MENYEKKYKEALSWAHSAIKAGADGMLKEDLERIFPELRESEDERIRKAIYNAIKYLETEHSWDFLDDVDILDAYAWLEKQSNISHFTYDDILALQCAMKTTEKADNELYEQLKSLHDRLHDVYWLEKAK